jgi:hypothetical protein
MELTDGGKMRQDNRYADDHDWVFEIAVPLRPLGTFAMLRRLRRCSHSQSLQPLSDLGLHRSVSVSSTVHIQVNHCSSISIFIKSTASFINCNKFHSIPPRQHISSHKPANEEESDRNSRCAISYTILRST